MNANSHHWPEMVNRERDRDLYRATKDPICRERLLWQAYSFRHLVHLLPGETILELGSGNGWLTVALASMSKGRNPITAARFVDIAPTPENTPPSVEDVHLAEMPSTLKGRTFDYVVANNILDRENASFLLEGIFDLLKDGGRVVFFESNPWTPFFATRNIFRKLQGMPPENNLMNRAELYELFSEIGFLRVSALFTDFVYRPLTPKLAWLFKGLSTILENMPFVRCLAGQILIHAQKPPRDAPRNQVSLVRHKSLKGKISVVVPCHNEQMNIEPLVNGLRNHYDEYIHQIVLVDDNSVDETRQVIEGLAEKDSRITPVFRIPPNGVGYTLKDGYQAATGEYILSMDCDFQHLLPELEDMFDAAAEGFDAVLGSRFSRYSVLINYPFQKILANRAFHLTMNILFRCWRRDLTNNLKLMRTNLVRKMTLIEPGFAANAEIGLQLLLLDCSMKEVPISWINRTFDMGQSTFRVFGSGGGYIRTLFHLAWVTKFGFKPLPAPAASLRIPLG
ncbi:MAG: glycosyltransferase [Rhodospirillales bacterium]|nr:glycosyltransferase [Rhodospirillales bacterium]